MNDVLHTCSIRVSLSVSSWLKTVSFFYCERGRLPSSFDLFFKVSADRPSSICVELAFSPGGSLLFPLVVRSRMAATATLASTSSSSSSAANDSSDPPALLPTSFALVPDFDSTQQESSNSIGELEGRTELSIRLRRATTAAHHNVRKPTIVA